MENLSVCFVPRLTLVERPSSLLWSVVLRAVALVVRSGALFPLFVVTSLWHTHDAPSAMAQGKMPLSSQHNSFHYAW